MQQQPPRSTFSYEELMQERAKITKELSDRYEQKIYEIMDQDKKALNLQMALNESMFTDNLRVGMQLEYAKKNLAAIETQNTYLQHENDQLKTRTADDHIRIQHLERSLASYDAFYATQNDTIRVLKYELSGYHQFLADFEKSIQAFEPLVTQLDQRVTHARLASPGLAEIQERDEIIARLQTSLRDLAASDEKKSDNEFCIFEKTIKGLDADLKERDLTIELLYGELQDKDENIARLRNELRDKNENIAKLHQDRRAEQTLLQDEHEKTLQSMHESFDTLFFKFKGVATERDATRTRVKELEDEIERL